MKQILVSNCGECPFTNEAKTYCYHPDILCDHDGDDRISTDVIHRNCPLHDAPDRPTIEEVEEAAQDYVTKLKFAGFYNLEEQIRLAENLLALVRRAMGGKA